MAPYNYLDFSLKIPVSQPLEKKVPFKRPDLHHMFMCMKLTVGLWTWHLAHSPFRIVCQ